MHYAHFQQSIYWLSSTPLYMIGTHCNLASRVRNSFHVKCKSSRCAVCEADDAHARHKVPGNTNRVEPYQAGWHASPAIQ